MPDVWAARKPNMVAMFNSFKTEAPSGFVYPRAEIAPGKSCKPGARSQALPALVISCMAPGIPPAAWGVECFPLMRAVFTFYLQMRPDFLQRALTRRVEAHLA